MKRKWILSVDYELVLLKQILFNLTMLNRIIILLIGICYCQISAIIQYANFADRADYIISHGKNILGEEHEVVFSIKHSNADRLEKILADISDPFLPQNYGRFLNRKEISSLIANEVGLTSLKKYLAHHEIDIVEETLYGEYVTARASISKWETVFSTEFYSFQNVGNQNYIYRANHYSLDDVIAQHISAVFNVIDLPLPHHTLNLIHLESSPESSKVTPSSLNSFYNIFNNIGSKDVKHRLYSSGAQFISTEDTATFRSKYGIRTHDLGDSLLTESQPNGCINSNDCGDNNFEAQYSTAIAQDVDFMTM